jgi:tetratricopeptide (TPR) repeat protein
MKKMTIVFVAFLIILGGSIGAQDLNSAGQAYNDGIALIQENKHYEAIEAFNKCASICRELGEVGEGLMNKALTQITSQYMKLGIDAFQAKDYDTAVSLFLLSAENAISSGNPESAKKADDYIATTYTAIGNNLYKEKKYNDAIGNFLKALDYNPVFLKAHYGLVISYSKTDNTDEMETAIQKVITIGGDEKTVERAKNVAANYYLNLSAEAIKKESYREASMMARKSIEYNYLEPTAYYYQALSNNYLENWDEAIKAAQTGMKPEQDDKSNLYFELGRAYQGKGDQEKACEAYSKVSGGPNLDAANYQRNTVLKCN